MKLLVTKLLITLGLLSIFEGTTEHFKAHAKETSTSSGTRACGDTMGGRSGGCGKSG